MTGERGYFKELRRRNVPRAAAVYVAAAWALAQGIAQLGPALGMPAWGTRWFIVACAIGFPFWIAFAWLYQFTPHGLKRDSEVAPAESIGPATARKLDYWIIGILAAAVVLLVTNQFVVRRDATSRARAGDAMAFAAALAKLPAKSIAVLPFENRSDDRNNEYFVSGMQDLILTRLSDIGDLKVISRTSTRKYASRPANLKQVAVELGVATLLEGSVQKAEHEVLISVQLIDARSNTHLWAETYRRTLDDIFGVEGEVAEKIATALDAKLSPAQTAQLAAAPTTNRDAYDLFLRAEYQANSGSRNYVTTGWKSSIPLYREAIRHDPGFAQAWAKLSYAESVLAWFGGGGGDSRELIRQARADAEQALSLAPHAASSLLAVGYSDYYGRSDFPSALKAFDAALAVRPNDADALAARGYVERRQGRFDAAIASLEAALAHDPRNSGLAFEVGNTNMMASRYPDARQWFQHSLALDPNNLSAKSYRAFAILLGGGPMQQAQAAAQGDSSVLKQLRVNLLTCQRRYRDAIALLESIPDQSDNFPVTGTNFAFYGYRDLQLADLYRHAGDQGKARRLYAEVLPKARAQLARHQGINLTFIWQQVAAAELGLGHTEQGLDAIGKSLAVGAKSPDPTYRGIILQVNAALYAQARRPDLAVPMLAEALETVGIGYWYSPVLLWLDPSWDPIRTDASFQSLLQQYAKYKPGASHDNVPADTTAGP